MSNAPPDLLDLRAQLASVTGVPAADIGIAADPSHLTSGGYHCGGLDLRAINAVGSNDYSIRQPRDRAYYSWEIAHGSNLASAMDLADDWPRGGRAAWLRFNNSLRALAGAGDPDLAAVRGFNYSPDGTTKRRFDCLTHQESSSSDTVTWHTHIEWWRDTVAQVVRRTSINRLVEIATAAINNTKVGSMAEWTQKQINDLVYTTTGSAQGPVHTNFATIKANLAVIMAAVGQPFPVAEIAPVLAAAVAETLAADESLPHITDADVQRIAQSTSSVFADHLGAAVNPAP
jgi:hypothetical protein